MGNEPSWADLALAEFLSVAEDCFDSQTLESWPVLRAYRNKVLHHPRLNSYVLSRPATLF